MVSGTQDSLRGTDAAEQQFPPITEITVASMACVIVGGIYMASYLPKTAPLVLPTLLAVLATALLAAAVFALNRLQTFDRDTFFLVVRWTLLAYVVIAGMLEYVFVVDHTRGGMLVLITIMLLIYAVDIPLLLGFSVARYQPANESGA